MKLLASLHDPKNERYAVYYSGILLVVICAITLLVTGIFSISAIEGTMMFFEGFVALFMLARHKKVSHSFANHISKINLNVRNSFSMITRINFRKD